MIWCRGLFGNHPDTNTHLTIHLDCMAFLWYEITLCCNISNVTLCCNIENVGTFENVISCSSSVCFNSM